MGIYGPASEIRRYFIFVGLLHAGVSGRTSPHIGYIISGVPLPIAYENFSSISAALTAFLR